MSRGATTGLSRQHLLPSALGAQQCQPIHKSMRTLCLFRVTLNDHLLFSHLYFRTVLYVCVLCIYVGVCVFVCVCWCVVGHQLPTLWLVRKAQISHSCMVISPISITVLGGIEITTWQTQHENKTRNLRAFICNSEGINLGRFQ